ncbi:MAG: hypothetical protein V1827_02155 [Candidatus Micrarchaeota archaeon]
MKSVKHQRIFSVVLGFGLVIIGSFYVLPFMIAAYLFGMMLIGFGLNSKMSEDDPPVASKPAKAVKSKKPSKRRKA